VRLQLPDALGSLQIRGLRRPGPSARGASLRRAAGRGRFGRGRRKRMNYATYGNTGLKISRLCIGCGHFRNTHPDVEEGGRFLLRVLERGVTFWDTAESYGSHPHVGAALRQIDRGRVVLQTKTSDKSYEKAAERIEAALRDMGTEYLDVILLHAVNSPRDLAEREGA